MAADPLFLSQAPTLPISGSTQSGCDLITSRI